MSFSPAESTPASTRIEWRPAIMAKARRAKSRASIDWRHRSSSDCPRYRQSSRNRAKPGIGLVPRKVHTHEAPHAAGLQHKDLRKVTRFGRFASASADLSVHLHGTPDRLAVFAARASRYRGCRRPEPASVDAERGLRQFADRIAYSVARSSSGTAERAA